MKKYILKSLVIVSLLFCAFALCSSDMLSGDKGQPEEKIEDPKPGFRNLGPQVTERLMQGSTFAKSKDGREFVYTVVRGTFAHLVGVDLETKKIVVDLPLEGSNGVWDLKVTTDGWLYIAGNERNFYRHMPGSNEVVNLGEVLPGEHYIWELAPGKDGEVFGATYPGGKVFRYHPVDGFSDVGKGALVTGESYVRSLVYHEKSDKLYAGIGAHAHLVELDARTGEKREFLPDEFKGEEFVYSLSLVKDSNKGDKLFIYLTNSRKVIVYNIDKKAFEGEGPEGMHVKSMFKPETANIVYYSHLTSLYMLDLNTSETTLVGDVGGKVLIMDWKEGGVLQFLTDGSRLFEYDSTTKDLQSVGLQIPAQPIQLRSVAVGPGNQIWTGGYLTGSNATYDPATGKTTMYRGLHQAESISSMGSFVFFGIYPGSLIYRYDTRKPWDISSRNPKRLAKIEGQDRPYGNLPVPELNRVYFGTVPNYGKNGGAVVEYDMTTSEVTTFNQVVNDQSIISFVYSDGLLYGGTSNAGGLGIAPTQTEAKLFVWDPVAKKKLFECVPVKGAKAISTIVEGPNGNLWGFASGTFFIFNPKTRTVISQKKLFNYSKEIGRNDPGRIIFHPNGKVYCLELSNFFELNPDNLAITILDKPANYLVMSERNVFYFARGKDLWEYTP